jgi:hypothetical protein
VPFRNSNLKKNLRIALQKHRLKPHTLRAAGQRPSNVFLYRLEISLKSLACYNQYCQCRSPYYMS